MEHNGHEMEPAELLSSIIAQAMEGKYELCVENKGMVDAPPTLLGELPDGAGFIMPDVLEGHPTDNLPMMLTALAEGLLERVGSVRWKWLAYIVEGYAKPNLTALPENWERGQMEEEYKTNPATDIREGLIVTLFPWSGDALNATVFFTYDDNGLPVYEEPMTTQEQVGGLIADIFQSFTKACHIHETAQSN